MAWETLAANDIALYAELEIVSLDDIARDLVWSR